MINQVDLFCWESKRWLIYLQTHVELSCSFSDILGLTQTDFDTLTLLHTASIDFISINKCKSKYSTIFVTCFCSKSAFPCWSDISLYQLLNGCLALGNEGHSSQGWQCDMNSCLGNFSSMLVSYLKDMWLCNPVSTCLVLLCWDCEPS